MGILAWLLAAPVWAGASAAPAIVLGENLAADAALARERRVPLLLFYTRTGCSWCEMARRDLLPLATDPAWTERVLIREVVLGSDARLKDFGARNSTHGAFAEARKIGLAPTLEFVDERGQHLVEPMVGMRTPDFYAATIERAIEDSLARLRAPLRVTQRSSP